MIGRTVIREFMDDGVTPRCIEEVVHYEGLGRYSHQCQRKGKVQREASNWRAAGWYCKQHDPVAKKERSEKNYQDWMAKQARERMERDQKTEFENVGRYMAQYEPATYNRAVAEIEDLKRSNQWQS